LWIYNWLLLLDIINNIDTGRKDQQDIVARKNIFSKLSGQKEKGKCFKFYTQKRRNLIEMTEPAYVIYDPFMDLGVRCLCTHVFIETTTGTKRNFIQEWLL
jgi:hypothetical protein